MNNSPIFSRCARTNTWTNKLWRGLKGLAGKRRELMHNHEQAIELTNDWNTNPRWQGITRPYPASEVVRLRGLVQLHYTLAQVGATRLWHLLSTEPFVRALG